MSVKKADGRILSASRARVCAWVLGLTLGIYAVCLYVSQLPTFLHLQMNADGLQSISYIWDLRHHKYAWDGIQWPRTPHFFPDLSAQAVVSFLTPFDGWALFAYNFAQFSAFILVAGYITFLLSESSLLASITVSAAVISLATLADSMLPGSTGLLLKYFLPINHFGPFVASLIGSILVFKLIEKWSSAAAVGLFIISALSILSDKLLIFSFVIPVSLAAAMTSYIMGRPVPRRVCTLIAIIIMSATVAKGIDTTLNRQQDISIELGQMPTRAQRFISESFQYFQAHTLPCTICLVLPLITFLLYPLVFRPTGAARKTFLGQFPSKSDKPPSPEADVATFFFWLHACFSILAVVGLTALIAYIDEGSFRYLVPAFSWVLIFSAAAIARIGRARSTIYFVSFVGALLLCFSLIRQEDLRPGPVTWRFPLGDCLKGVPELKAGISEYWLSRPLMFASGWFLQVNQAASDGAPYFLETDRHWFTKSFIDPHHRPIYNFVVITPRAGWDKRKVSTPETLRLESIIGRFGEPDHIHICAGGERIWVYEDAKRFTQTFLSGITERTESYKTSCMSTLRIGARLFALCPSSDNHWKVSTLNASECVGDIGNNDGRLTCASTQLSQH